MIQAWLSHYRFDRTIYSWIRLSFLGLVVAYLSAFFLGLSLSLFARLDPLQNSPDGTIVFTSATVSFARKHQQIHTSSCSQRHSRIGDMDIARTTDTCA